MSLIQTLKRAARLKSGEVTVPGLAQRFKVSQSTADNWVRRGVDLGLLERHRPAPGAWENAKGSVGRPPCTYTLTAAGKAAAKAGEIPKREGKPSKPRKSAKPRKAKAKAPKSGKRKSSKPRKAKAAKHVDVAAEEAKREAKRERDRRYRARKRAERQAAANA